MIWYYQKLYFPQIFFFLFFPPFDFLPNLQNVVAVRACMCVILCICDITTPRMKLLRANYKYTRLLRRCWIRRIFQQRAAHLQLLWLRHPFRRIPSEGRRRCHPLTGPRVSWRQNYNINFGLLLYRCYFIFMRKYKISEIPWNVWPYKGMMWSKVFLIGPVHLIKTIC